MSAQTIKINMDKVKQAIDAIPYRGRKEVCRKMGVDESYLSKTKAGQFKQISFENLGKFCNALNLNIYEFIEGGRFINLDDMPQDLANEIWETILRYAAKKSIGR